jgi:hypothetical protein
LFQPGLQLRPGENAKHPPWIVAEIALLLEVVMEMPELHLRRDIRSAVIEIGDFQSTLG